jgi:hypothetical protein
MNNIKAEYNLETYSVNLKVTIEAIPQMGVDINGPYQRATWSDCLQAMAVLMEAIETDKDTLASIIEGEINGNSDGNEPSED